MNNTPMSSVAKGLIVSAILIGFSIIIINLKQDANANLGFVPVSILFIGTLAGSLLYAKQMQGSAGFLGIFIHGFKMAAFVAATMSLWLVLTLKFNIWGVMDHALEIVKKSLQKAGEMTNEEITQQLANYKKGAAPMSAILNTILYLFIGAIGAVTGAFFAPSNTSNTINTLAEKKN